MGLNFTILSWKWHCKKIYLANTLSYLFLLTYEISCNLKVFNLSFQWKEMLQESF